MKRSEIETKVREIVALQFDSRLADIKMATVFINDLGADSLDFVELIMSVEDRFDLTITDKEADILLTVQSVVDFVEIKIANKSSKY